MMSDDKWAGRVSADMERIFRRGDRAPAGPAPHRGTGDRSRGFVLQSPPQRQTAPSRVMRALTIVVPLLAVVAAILLFVQIVPDMRPAVAVAQARPESAPASAPTPMAEPARPAPVAFHAAAPIAIEADDELPAPSPPVEVRRVRPAARRAATVVAPVAVRGDGCRPDSVDNACIYRDVRAADRRLVAAYRDAAEAGVPRGEMVAIRREWTRALADSLDDPDGTIRIYDDLARRLRDAAARMAGRRA